MESKYDKYEAVIGLEVHAQLLTSSKAYSSDPNLYGEHPNSLISEITLGHPGTLPRMNRKSIDHAVRLGIALNCTIADRMIFARKNYFYPDLPKGYQITQDKTPICTGGHVDIKTDDGTPKQIRLVRIHLEEDAGKSIHDQDPFHTLVDLNRAGVPLVEIVSEPDLCTSQEAYNYLTEVRKIVRYLDICDGNMEEGSLRCDANVSVRLKGVKEFGRKVEVKNMNSIRNVQRAIEFEIRRQIDVIEDGGIVDMETRSFDAAKGITISMRSKEAAHDYRYFPEPDLQPVTISAEHKERIKSNMPPLPQQLFRKYTAELGLSEYDAGVLTDSKEVALYFEEVIQHTPNVKAAANWVMVDVKGWLNQNAAHISEFPLKSEQLASIIALIDAGKVSHSVASQKIFPEFVAHPENNPLAIAEANNWIQEGDEAFILNLVQDAIAKNPAQVEKYKSGNKGMVGFFMGEVMKGSKGKADPKTASALVTKALEEA
jgi:aspartyl-tRNA(Asn)/glutamyl-tRNA(Gln) amidotransferase subunit B